MAEFDYVGYKDEYALELLECGEILPFKYLLDFLWNLTLEDEYSDEEIEEMAEMPEKYNIVSDLMLEIRDYYSTNYYNLTKDEKKIAEIAKKLVLDTYELKYTEAEYYEQLVNLINIFENRESQHYQPSHDELTKMLEEEFRDADERLAEYVPEYGRSFDIDLNEKPDSVDEMMMATFIDEHNVGFTTPMADIFGDDYKIYRLNERVGLDQCHFSLRVKSVDEDKLKKAKDCKKAMYHLIDKADTDANFSSMDLPGVKNCYSNITLLISDYIKITLSKNNIKGARGGEKSDIALIHVLVQPDDKHWALGNFKNYSYQEMLSQIYTAMDIAAELGIEFDRNVIELNYIELNLTFHSNYEFLRLEEPLKYFMTYLKNKKYTCAEYVKNSTKTYKVDGTIKRKKALEIQGMQAYNGSLSVKIYDKAYESRQSLVATSEDIKDLIFDPKDLSFVRLEYTIKKKKILEDVFGTINFLELDDYAFEKVFAELTDKYFKRPYIAYVKDAKEILKDIVKDIKPSINRKWRVDLIKNLRDEEKLFRSTPAYLGEADIDYIIGCNDAFYVNRRYYKPILIELLSSSDIFVVASNDSNYRLLANFFAKTYYLQQLHSARRLGYAVEYKD